jgi:hypothetical protein
LSGFNGLANSELGKRNIMPSCESVFFVPGGFSVADEDNSMKFGGR